MVRLSLLLVWLGWLLASAGHRRWEHWLKPMVQCLATHLLHASPAPAAQACATPLPTALQPITCLVMFYACRDDVL